MKGKVLNKVIASLLVVVLTVSYWGLLAQTAYAALEGLEEQKAQTNNKNVEFDAYFKTNEKTHSQTLLQSVEGKLYIKINVKEGYLKEGTIQIDNPNFMIAENPIKIEEPIEGEKEIEIPVAFEKQEEISLDYLSKESNVNLNATYIDEKGKERKISGDIKIHLTWTENAVAKVEQKVEKVIDLGEGRTLVQVSVKDYIENNSVPAESVKLNTEVLKIEGTEIESIDVYATKTILSNGTENGTSFSNENWTYNQEEGKIYINLENQKSEDGKIFWKDGEDEFKIIYILKSSETLENKTVNLKTTGEIKYNENSIAFEENKDATLTVSGNLINSTYTITESSNKGYIYSKTEDTEYQTKVTTEISYSELIDNINIKMNRDTFVDLNDNTIKSNATVYKRAEISKATFNTLFGEEGKIEIYADGEKQAEITKDSEADKNGNIVINYEEGANEVEVRTTKPVAEGKLEINNIKAIKAKNGYSKEEVQKLAGLKSKTEIITNISKETKTATMNLKDTLTKAELTMLTDKVSTVMKNEDVEIKVLFRTDSNMYDLYKNPYLEIKLPKEVETVEIESIAAAFAEGFKLDWYDVVEQNGNKVIRISLKGEQTRYALDISEGMSLIVKTKMTLDKKSGSKDEVIELKYRNENAIDYDNGGKAEGKLTIEAPTGVVAINTMSNYNEKGETVTSLSSKEQVGELEILTDKQTATVTIDVVNNHESKIENPTILGRLPVKGNKKIDGEELGSTFTQAIVGGIKKTEGLEETDYSIYYSNNAEATNDLNNQANGWTENLSKVEEPKSYLIATNNCEMEQGNAMSFEYQVEIPENLNHNEASYSTYAVDYQVEEEGTVRNETIQAPTVGTTTGEGPVLEVSLNTNTENNAEVEEEQILKYNVVIKNTGTVEAKNVKVTGTIPENTVYVKIANSEDFYGSTLTYLEYPDVKEYTENIETIPSGGEHTVSYEVKVGKLLDETEGEIDPEAAKKNIDTLKAKAKITADELGKELETNECENKIVKGTIKLSLDATFKDNITLKEGDRIKFSGNVVNKSDVNKENAVVVYNIPAGLNIEKVELKKGTEDISDRAVINDGKINFNIGTFESYSNVSIAIIARVAEFGANEYERTMVSKLELDGKYSNEIVNYAAAPKITVSYTSSSDKYIETNSDVEYYIEIANSGKVQARNVKVEDTLPEELNLKEFVVELEGNKEKSYVSKDVTVDIPAESTTTVTLKAIVNSNAQDGKEVTNQPTLKGDNIDEKTLEPITHVITATKEFKDPNSSNSSNGSDSGSNNSDNKVTTNSISGTAWNDSNKDGRRDSNENKLSGIQVILINNATGEIAKNVLTNLDQKTTTDANGSYKFDGVTAGEYIVIFLYDTGKYSLTTYKKAGVLESENSDAVKADVKIDSSSKEAGVTSAFKVNGKSVTGMNIGLLEMDKAVFSINKVVTKMSMKNPKTSKNVSFKNSKLAKMDADWKYIDSTTFVIEYKLIVSNEGTVPGYVKKIVDNVPSQLKFSSDLNNKWYAGTNNAVYNTSLANTIINPGESKEVTLILTKIMNENGNGIFHNTAEITEAYNEHGLENVIVKDSNKQSADVMIGIRTGSGVVYVSLIFTIMGLMGLAVYVMNKKVFTKVIDKKLEFLDKM